MTILPKPETKKKPKKRPQVPPAMIALVLQRDEDQCVLAVPGLCLGKASTADHRANRGSGGSHTLNNPADLIGACVLCNGWKEDAAGDALVELKRRGVRVEKDSTNAKTLLRCLNTIVEYPDGTRWLLNERGTRQGPVI